MHQPEPISWASTAERLPNRQAAGHKGTFGRVTLVAGSPLTPGAAILCALGALRSGVGLVRWATQTSIVHLAPPRPPELMLALRDYLDGGDDAEVWAAHILSFGPYLVIGPGLGQTQSTGVLLDALLRCAVGPVCLDADALNLLALEPARLGRLPAGSILTPHPKEMARLCNTRLHTVTQEPLQAACTLAQATGCIIVLKLAQTTVAAPNGRCAQTAPSGVSALAHGGTGDVLAGLVGGLLAQGNKPYDAACAAVALHRRAGELAAARHGHAGTMASDVAFCIGEAWAACAP